MAAAIVAAVRSEGHDRAGSFAAWHLTGLLAGAAVLGLLVAAAGAALARLDPPVIPVLGVAALAWGVASLAGRPLPVRSSPHQVPQAWSAVLSPPGYLFWYGAGLGIGFATKVPTLSFYVMVGYLVAVGDPLVVAVAMPVYALARWVPVLLAARTPDPTGDADTARETRRAMAFRLDAGVLAVFGVACLLMA